MTSCLKQAEERTLVVGRKLPCTSGLAQLHGGINSPMEPTTRKAKRAPSSLLHRVTDICKVHSVGTTTPTVREKLPKADSTATGDSSKDGAHLKVHPQ